MEPGLSVCLAPQLGRCCTGKKDLGEGLRDRVAGGGVDLVAFGGEVMADPAQGRALGLASG